MEIVIATTSTAHAQHMQQTLVGHTMSGEGLERRSPVQLTGAADFLDAAMRIYEITAIRLAPSTMYPSLIDVIAEYRPAVFYCEACGKEHSNYPERVYELDGISRRFVCSPACRKRLQAIADAEIETFRAQLGNPVEAALRDYYYNRIRIPDRLRNALTMAEWEEVGRRGSAVWSAAQRGLLGVLSSHCIQQRSVFPERRSTERAVWIPPQTKQQDLWGEREGGQMMTKQQVLMERDTNDSKRGGGHE